MSVYIPPFPARPEQEPPLLALLWQAHRNFLGIWPASSFEQNSFSHRVLRRRFVFLNNPDLVREAFIDKAEIFQRKSPQQRHALEPLIGDGLFVSDGDTWRTRRQAVQTVTHVSRLAELAPAMTEGARERRDAWRSLPPGAEIDALSDMAELTAGIICASIFGRDLGREAARTVVKSFSAYQDLIGITDLASLLGLPDWLPRIQGWRVRRSARRIQDVLDRLIARTMAGEGEQEGGSSLVSALSRATDPDGRPFTAEAIRNEAAVLFMAGHETTANTLAWAWFLLSQDPGTEARLHEEVDSALADGGAATFADVKALPFTRAVLEETLRLYPPVPLQVRETTADTKLGSRDMKRGDLVVLNAWTLHRHRKLWPDPDAFVPDRFLPGGSGLPSRYAYVPFSIGPRICTGAAFGLTEAVICLATLSRAFRLRLRPGHAVMPTCRLSLRPGRALPMLVEPRT